LNAIVILDEKVEPGFKVGGIGPGDAENPFPKGVTETPRDERLAGMFPVFLIV
jgi:hypothetical protein